MLLISFIVNIRLLAVSFDDIVTFELFLAKYIDRDNIFVINKKRSSLF